MLPDEDGLGGGPPWVSGAFSHVGVTVPDLQAGVTWYTEVLGLTLIAGPLEVAEDNTALGRAATAIYGEGFGSFRFAHLVGPDAIGVELFTFAATAPGESAAFEPARVGVSHLAVTHRDVSGLCARISDAGGSVRPVVELDPVRGYRLAYCFDPWGTAIEVCSHPYAVLWANGS